MNTVPLLGSERHWPQRLPVASIPRNERPVCSELLPGDLPELVVEHVAKAFTTVHWETNCGVGDHVVVRVSIFREQEAHSKTARVRIDIGVRNVMVASVAAESCQKLC